ncbi:Hsp70 family protein [Paenibacillus gansuensis]|uniref:Chaperone protein DnaK n=1 Tax=Paenibacillus gansuensis TaxID=306542 RepID=A0ABW5PA85_9BACL
MPKYYAGIDLGTTNSSIALLDPYTGEVDMKKVDIGETPYIVRSILSKDEEGQWILGNQAAAVDRLRSRTVFSVKTELRRDMNFSLSLDEETYTLVDLYAVFIKELLKKAGIDHPRKVERLTLSIPVNFDENRKSVMEKAAEKLGIPREQVWFLDEPVSVLWDCRNIPGQYVLVFDFGGGTLDLAIMDKYETEEAKEGAVQVLRELTGEGDNRYHGKVVAKVGLDIGGDDLDDVIIKYFVEQGKEQGNPVCQSLSLEVFDDPERLHKLKSHPKFTFYYQLKAAAEKVKKALSVEEVFALTIPPLVPGVDEGIKGITYTLEQFLTGTEKVRNAMLQGLKQLNDAFAAETGLQRHSIDAVLLSGGSSLISFVPDLLEELYPNARIVWDEEHLQTRIARGNARYTKSEGEILVGDAVNASFGIYNHAGKETIVMIEASEQYPVRKVKRVATTKTNQTKIEIVPMVRKGADFEPLRRNGSPVFWRMNIQPHQQTMDLSRITVTYAIDKSQRLRITAYDNLFKSEIGVEEISLADTSG